MFLQSVLWLWIPAIIPAIAAFHVLSPTDFQLLSRLSQLERLTADHQAQLKREHDQWEKERQVLTDNFQLLQEDVHALQREKGEMRAEIEALQKAQTETASLVEDNRNLNAEVGELRHMLKSINKKQAMESNSFEQKRDGDSSQHVQSVRSDDHGSLGVVTDHLAQQVTQLTADVHALQSATTQQRQDIQTARGSTFVHWGSLTCPGTSETVYSGVLGGSYQDHTGGASSMLCMSMSPTLLNITAGTTYTNLYGGEYETHDSKQDTDPVCAVCRPTQSTTIMVPGTNLCSAGWTLQYSGFLMAGYWNHRSATEFICVDSKLGSEEHSYVNNNGRLLYFTVAQCGSLPCPPYINNKVITCAVCSK